MPQKLPIIAIMKVLHFPIWMVAALICIDAYHAQCKPITLHRFDSDIQQLDFKNQTKIDGFIASYKPVLTNFVSPLLQDSTLSLTDKLETFANLDNIKFFYADVANAFPDVAGIAQELTAIDSLLSQKFALKLPPIYTIISPFNQSIVLLNDSAIGIALNHYLGASYKPYSYYPTYIRRFKTKEKIPYHVAEVWLKTQFPYVPSDSSLIEQMLYEGAIAYAAKSVIPDFSDAMYFSFAPEQQEWIVQNENVAWQKISGDGMLPSTEPAIRRSLLNPAPFASAISPSAPGGTGKWIGMRIVEAYLAREKSSIADFLRNRTYQNAKTVLTESQYGKQ